MATYTWNYGAAGSGLHFTIVFDTDTNKFTVTSHEGSFDLNALSWGDDVDDGAEPVLSKADNSLNMNGANTVWDDDGNATSEDIDWDGYQKLSKPGLGTEGEDKSSFISEGEELCIDAGADFLAFLSGLGEGEDFTLGVRATSVNGDGSIKFADTDPEYATPPQGEDDHFPEWGAPDISHVTFYFETGDDPYYEGDDSGLEVPTGKGNSTTNEPDGWFTVKFDVEDDVAPLVSNDLDDWFDEALAQIAADNPNLDMTTLAGVSIKGGQDEQWYDLDNDPDDDDSANAPDVWVVENKEVDATYDVSFDGTDYIFV